MKMDAVDRYMDMHGLNDEHVCLHFENGMVYPERARARRPLGVPVRIGGGIFIADSVGSKDEPLTIIASDGKPVAYGSTRLFPFDQEVGRDITMEDYKRISRCTYLMGDGNTVIVTGVKMHNSTPERVCPTVPTFPFMTSCSGCGCLIPFMEELGAGWPGKNGGRLCERCMEARR